MAKLVKLTWTRDDTTQYGHYHPYTHFKCSASFDEENKLTGTEMQTYEANRRVFRMNPMCRTFNYNNYGIGLGMLLETGAWRSVTEHRMTFAVESFNDEIAHEMGQDPIDYHLDMLSKRIDIVSETGRVKVARAKRVLESVRQKSLWDESLPSGYGRGVALGRLNSTLVAQVAQVATVRVQGGRLAIEKVTCVTDSGSMINPQMAKGQLEGGSYGGLPL